MKAKNLVGKWIVSKVVADELNAPADTAFKVVGYVPDTDWAIVDAEQRGWKELISGDVAVEECETYMYAHMDYITTIKDNEIMKAEELLGMWVVSDVLTDELNAPVGTAFKVVGHVQDTDLVIVDARRWGWTGLNPEDIVFEQGETYKYAHQDEITIVSQQLRP